MQENKDLKPAYVQKADLALADLTGAGVTLYPDVRDRFFLVNIKGQVMLERVRVVTMTRETEDIPKMTTFGSQVWFPATEATAPSLAQRVKPGLDLVQMTSKEIIAQVDFPRYVLQTQVEGPAFKNTMIGYLGVHTRRDLEKLVINGNTVTGANSLLLMHNGMLALTTANVYPAAGALSTTILTNLLLTQPEEFANEPNQGYFTNRVAWSAVQREYAARGTPLGDSNTSGGVAGFPSINVGGFMLHYVPEFPNNLGVGLNETVVWYGNPKGFVFGFHENVEMQSEYNIRERTWTIVLTARTAQQFEHAAAWAKATGVTGA